MAPQTIFALRIPAPGAFQPTDLAISLQSHCNRLRTPISFLRQFRCNASLLQIPSQCPSGTRFLQHARIACASRAPPVFFSLERSDMPTGTVKWFNETKGFGFIKPDDGGSDVFAHYSGIKSKGFRTLKENQRVEYQVQQGQKGPQAVEINVLS